jgi:hypothetical protein
MNADFLRIIPIEKIALGVAALAVVVFVLYFIAPERTARAFALFFATIRSVVRIKRFARGQPDPAPAPTLEEVKGKRRTPATAPPTISDYVIPPPGARRQREDVHNGDRE